MFDFLKTSTIACTLALLGASALPVQAQARYDGEKPAERFGIRLGGFRQGDINTTLRVDSTTLGLGAIIELEDKLRVENEVSVFRVDGFFRFNHKHRLDWAFYETKRDGVVTLLEDLQIGDIVFTEGETLKTEYNNVLFKVSWSYSFINVERYEFYLGAGLNFRDLEFIATDTIGGGVDSEDEEILAPLPVINFGARYNFTGKSSLNWEYEVFALEYGDFDGRFQESTLLFEHNTFGHIGFGGGFSSFNFDLVIDDNDWRGEVESNYLGLLAYVKGYF